MKYWTLWVLVLGSIVAMTNAAHAQTPVASECLPSCRAGFVCLQGQCVSACNPPCGAGEICTGEGQCARAIVQPVLVPVAASPANPGWARGAAIFGIINVALLTGGTTAVILMNGSDAANIAGAVVTGYGAVTIPIVAVGTGSARGPGVRGVPGLRVAGWVSYALALCDAVVAVSLGFAGISTPSVAIAGVGVLADLSNIFFAIDGFTAASQADRALATVPLSSRERTRPGFVAPVPLALSDGRSITPGFGLAMSF